MRLLAIEDFTFHRRTFIHNSVSLCINLSGFEFEPVALTSFHRRANDVFVLICFLFLSSTFFFEDSPGRIEGE